MPHEFPFEKVPPEVVRHLAEELGVDAPLLTSAVETTLPTGELARLVSASRPEEPNVVAHVTITDAGELRPLAELERLAGGRSLFVPSFESGVLVPRPHREPVTIDPRSNDWQLNKCDRIVEKITVTVPPTGAAPKADVYLLADTTGSMAPVIAAVKAGASQILNHPGLAGFDVAWGVGNYRDFPVGTGINSFAFAHQVSPTTSHPAVDAGIGAWSAGEGGDGPEGQLHAMHRIATDASIGWRSDAKRILVWFGDAPGHDPVPAALSGLGADVTEGSATADLVAAGITVVAVSTTTGYPAALDDDPNATSFDYAPSVPAGAAGQAGRITAATSGSHTTGIDPDAIVTTLGTLIAAAVASTGSVSLVPTGDTAQFVESITPPSYGPLAGDEEHVLTFEVVWVGVRACQERQQVFTGTIDVVADGVVVASKDVRVTVPPCRYHYTVEIVAGREPEERHDCHPVVPGRYATAVTIYNPLTCEVHIEKRFAPLVADAKVIAREPRTSRAKRFAKIDLEPGEATMDDRCSLADVVKLDDGLLLGVLDIVADRPISVIAVHTADDRESGPSISTRAIEPQRAP